MLFYIWRPTNIKTIMNTFWKTSKKIANHQAVPGSSLRAASNLHLGRNPKSLLADWKSAFGQIDTVDLHLGTGRTNLTSSNSINISDLKQKKKQNKSNTIYGCDMPWRKKRTQTVTSKHVLYRSSHAFREVGRKPWDVAAQLIEV